MTGIRRFVFIFTLVLWAALAVEVRAQCMPVEDLLTPPPQGEAESETGALRSDRVGRMVAMVGVNGRGPYRFIVDTGANRSVLSQDLANELGLVPSGVGEVHSVHDVTTAPLVHVDSLTYGRVSLPTQLMPVLQGPVLAGQAGLLGVDGMAGRLLRLDFARRCIEITPSRPSARMAGWTSVRGELRFGHLVVLRGRIRNVDVNVLVDTGSDGTLANVALRTALRARARNRQDALDYARAYSAGEPVVLDSAIALPELVLGDIAVNDVLAFVGDFHIFELWGLHDEPTLLIGMDMLRRTRAIAIDYSRGIVHFRLNRGMPPPLLNARVRR